MPRKNPHAVALGRKGGRANKGRTSEAKAAAARENGKKGGRPKTKIAAWWEYDCPECETSNALPDPPFPALVICQECGRGWNTQKINAAGYIALQKERIPA
jgi:general stress protein YciG